MKKNITIKNKFLLVATLALLLTVGISIFTLLHKIDPATEKYLEICIILFTVCFQILVISQIKRKYASPKMQLYFIHPAFYINVAVIFFFFFPFVFFRFRSENYFWWLLMENLLKPLAYFCLSIIILNILFLFLDKQSPRLSKKIEEFDNIVDTIKEKLPIIFVLYGLSWVVRIANVLAGTYRYVLAGQEERLMVRMQYPLLYPAYMFFNSAIYFSVLFVLWALYFTVFKTNKKYKLFMICALLADILYYLPVGGKMNLLQPILAYGLAGLIFKQRVLKKLIIAFIVVFLTMPIYAAYRTAGGTQVGTIETLEAAQGKSLVEEKRYLSLSIDGLFARAEAFASYLYFTQKVEEGDFLHGATNVSILSGLLPDYLLPLPDYLKNKPLHELLRDRGILAPDERLRAGATAAWGEFYLDFGYAGVIIGVPLMGMFCLFMFRRVLHGQHGYLLLMYLYVPLYFTFQSHSGVQALITVLIRMGVVLFIVNFITKLNLKRPTRFPNKGDPGRVGGAY